ncbi:hypothetical protein VPH35_039988 [Triticum aestivum]
MGNLLCASVKKRYKREGSPPTETWSRSSTESATATHNFEVTDFSLLDGVGIGGFLRSSTFTVGGYEWELKIYPDGWKEEHKSAYVSVTLGLRKGRLPETGVKTTYTLSLLDEHGMPSKHTAGHRSIQNTFECLGSSCGFSTFVEKSNLRQLMALNGGSITVRCVLTVMKGHQTTEDVHTVLVPLPRLNLHINFLDMLKGGQGADVTFTVGGQSFLAHRCVLASRSPVFKAELFGKMNETLAESIKIDDMEPSIFEALLHFIYTDSLPDDRHEYNNRHTQMQHLLVAADRYGIERLMAMCEGQLCRNIKVQTVATTLALAEQHHCVHLKKACLAFLSSRDVRQAIKETDGFKHLVTSCPSVILEIFDKPPPHS